MAPSLSSRPESLGSVESSSKPFPPRRDLLRGLLPAGRDWLGVFAFFPSPLEWGAGGDRSTSSDNSPAGLAEAISFLQSPVSIFKRVESSLVRPASTFCCCCCLVCSSRISLRREAGWSDTVPLDFRNGKGQIKKTKIKTPNWDYLPMIRSLFCLSCFGSLGIALCCAQGKTRVPAAQSSQGGREWTPVQPAWSAGGGRNSGAGPGLEVWQQPRCTASFFRLGAGRTLAESCLLEGLARNMCCLLVGVGGVKSVVLSSVEF